MNESDVKRSYAWQIITAWSEEQCVSYLNMVDGKFPETSLIKERAACKLKLKELQAARRPKEPDICDLIMGDSA